MKKVLFCLSMVAMLMTACSKDEEENNNSALPPLPNPNDVCSAMDDAEFMKFCYDKFDINKDRAVSRTEADVAKEMDIFNARHYDCKSLKGIGYFTNLEILNCTDQQNLKEVDLSFNLKLKSIDFAYCSKLKDIVLPENLQIIATECFLGVDGLMTITLPESIKAIGCNAFCWCENLTTVYCKASVPPALYGYADEGIVTDWDDDDEWHWAWFSDTPISKIYVPKAAVSAYKQAKGWRKYASQIVGYDF